MNDDAKMSPETSGVFQKWKQSYMYNPYYGVSITPEGGNWKRMIAVDLLFLFVFMIPMIVSLLIAFFNPFCRERSMRWVIAGWEKVSIWELKIMYRVYLGTNPDVWLSLKAPY